MSSKTFTKPINCLERETVAESDAFRVKFFINSESKDGMSSGVPFWKSCLRHYDP